MRGISPQEGEVEADQRPIGMANEMHGATGATDHRFDGF